jgi:hypothetical protein
MKTNKSTHKPSRLLRNAGLMAIVCALGFPAIGSAQMADSDYRYDLDNAPQISRSIQTFMMGRTVQTRNQGELQMSLGASHERMGESAGSQRFSEISARAEFGLTDRLQLPYQIDDRQGSYSAQTNFGNAEVGATYSLLRGDDPISLSAAMDVQVPVGHQASLPASDNTLRTSDQTIWKPALIVAKDFGPTQVHTDLQAELGAGPSNRALNYNVGAVVPLGKFAPTMEFTGRTMDNRAPQFYATPGVSYSLSDRAQIGVGVPIGLNSQSTNSAVMAKFSFGLR